MTFPDDMQTIPRAGRLIGVDLGSKTIGIAMSDAGQMIATAMETIKRKTFTKDIQQIIKIVKDYDIVGMVVGYPINMDGSEGRRCQATRQFVKNVNKHLELPVTLWDERMSSLVVERAMLEADMSRQKRSKNIDKLAAAYILQGFMDSRPK